MAVLGGPAASPQCAADAPSEAWLGQRLTTWRIGLRVFGRFGRSLAGCASRVGSVGGVVDGRAQPAERLPRAPLVWVGGDGGGVELQQHPVHGGEQCGVELPQSLPAARVPDEYVFKPVAAASQGCQRAGQLDVVLRGRARGAAVCAPAERPEHPSPCRPSAPRRCTAPAWRNRGRPARRYAAAWRRAWRGRGCALRSRCALVPRGLSAVRPAGGLAAPAG